MTIVTCRKYTLQFVLVFPPFEKEAGDHYESRFNDGRI